MNIISFLWQFFLYFRLDLHSLTLIRSLRNGDVVQHHPESKRRNSHPLTSNEMDTKILLLFLKGKKKPTTLLIKLIIKPHPSSSIKWLIKISQIKKKQTPWPGIEPGSPAWQAGILTTILSGKTTHSNVINKWLYFAPPKIHRHFYFLYFWCVCF